MMQLILLAIMLSGQLIQASATTVEYQLPRAAISNQIPILQRRAPPQPAASKPVKTFNDAYAKATKAQLQAAQQHQKVKRFAATGPSTVSSAVSSGSNAMMNQQATSQAMSAANSKAQAKQLQNAKSKSKLQKRKRNQMPIT
jgi:hypothetical protein